MQREVIIVHGLDRVVRQLVTLRQDEPEDPFDNVHDGRSPWRLALRNATRVPGGLPVRGGTATFTRVLGRRCFKTAFGV